MRLDSRTVNRTTTTLTVAQDFGLRRHRDQEDIRSSRPRRSQCERFVLLSSYKDNRTRSNTYINQADNDDNENFTSAGDTNTVSEDTGYVRDYAEA